MLRYLMFIIGCVVALPLLALVAMAVTLPTSITGIGYLLGGVLAVVGLMLAPRLKNYYLLVIAGVILVVLIAGLRIFRTQQNANSNIRMIALPEGQAASWVNALVDEQDTLIFGETLFHFIGGDSDSEHYGLTFAFLNAYSEMRERGTYPSPVISTYLNLQQPDQFDAIIIASDTKKQPQFALVFLHGYMGNVTAQCWEIAQAVKTLGGMTICPSTGWRGEWWQPEGQAIIQSTFDYVRGQGIPRIYLGGFSNGGFSISRLASQWKDETGLNGLIFIDGFANGLDIREVGLPVLIIEGGQDERVPVTLARQFAQDVGDLGTYVELEGDHFLIMKHPDQVQNAIKEWLQIQESGKSR